MLRATKLLDRAVVMAGLLMLAAVSVRPSSRLLAASARREEVAGQPPRQATLKPAAASPDLPFNTIDTRAEQALLELANRSRAQAGVPSLKLDPDLSQAARVHAAAMVAERELSHQFDGEPGLAQRLADATRLQLDLEGENVAFDFDAADGHQHLMHSPPHRANLLNPAFNVVGLGVLRSAEHIYIVQDFGHALPGYTATEMKNRVSDALLQQRRQVRLPRLVRRDVAATDEAACSMAKAEKVGGISTQQLAQSASVLSYTTLRPDVLPAGAEQLLSRQSLRTFSVGACYSRTAAYPAGVYWIVLAIE